MNKLDILAITALTTIIFLYSSIIYKYDYYVSTLTESLLHEAIRLIDIYILAIIFSCLILPRWFEYKRKKQIEIEIGDVVIAPFLNYHPKDVKNHE